MHGENLKLHRFIFVNSNWAGYMEWMGYMCTEVMRMWPSIGWVPA